MVSKYGRYPQFWHRPRCNRKEAAWSLKAVPKYSSLSPRLHEEGTSLSAEASAQAGFEPLIPFQLSTFF